MTPAPRPRRPRSRATAVAAAALGMFVVAGTGATGAVGAHAITVPRPGSTTVAGTSTLAPKYSVAATTSRKAASPAPTRVSAGDPMATEVVRLVNVARAAAGCGSLRVDSRLTTAARLHSEDMALRDYFSHTSLDGRSPWDRIQAQGYTAGSGENIAAGYATPAAVMDAWMKSSGHRANILNCSSRAIGVGLGRGGSYGTYWTQDFVRE